MLERGGQNSLRINAIERRKSRSRHPTTKGFMALARVNPCCLASIKARFDDIRRQQSHRSPRLM